RKKEIASTYTKALSPIDGIEPQKVEEGVDPNHWLYTVKAPGQKALRKFLKEHLVEARPFWVPMHQLPAFSKDIYYPGPGGSVSGNIYKDCLSLPCSTHLKEDELGEVIRLIHKFYSLD